MKKNALRVVSAAMLVAFFMAGGAACEESAPALATVQFAAEGGEQSVQLVPGQVLEVILPGNPTTGYGWTLEGFETQDILGGPADAEFQSEAPDRMGAGGIFKFRFTAARSGSATIRFAYRRSWEKDVAPLYTAVLNVTVP
jgi:inhibitor of cysteine peptidase